MRRLWLSVAALALVASTASARAAVVMPTPPGGSTGTALAEVATGPSGTFMFIVLTGSLRLGDVTRHGSFLVDFPDSTSSSATLRLEDGNLTPIGTCTGENTVFLALDAPAAALLRCQGSFPGQGATRSTVLAFVLPSYQEAGCRQCSGVDYRGKYLG